MRSEGQIKRENKAKRNIPEIGGFFSQQSISDYLRENIRPEWNFLINGTGYNRECALFRRMEQLYSEESMYHRPIVMLTSEKSNVLNEFERAIAEKRVGFVRPFVKVAQDSPCYNPFLGLDANAIEEAIAAIAEFYPTINISNWNKNVFYAVCEILDKYGYVLSLDNLQKVFSKENEVIESMLRAEGKITQAQSANRDGFSAIYPSLNQLYNEFRWISSDQDRFSIISEVQKRRQESKRMPFFGFVLSDSFRRDFMECLAIELKEITKYCRPVLIIDSVALNQTTQTRRTRFFEYVSNAADLIINLSGEACSSLIPEDTLSDFVKAKGFRMCLTKGSAATEELTRIEVGVYDHIDINYSGGRVRGTFQVISHDKNYGMGESIDHDRARIRGMDIRDMGENEAYFTYRENAALVKGLIFDKN